METKAWTPFDAAMNTASRDPIAPARGLPDRGGAFGFAPRPQPRPDGLIRAAALSGYGTLAASLGLNVVQQMRRAGLPLEALLDAELPVPYAAMIALLEQSAAAARCADFGLQLACRQGLDILGPLSPLLEHAATLQQAIESACCYMFVHSPAIELSTVPANDCGSVELCFSIRVPHGGAAVQATELALGVMLRCLGMLGQRSAPPLAVLLPHERVAELDRYERAYGARCLFGQPRAAVRLRADDLLRPLPRSDPALRALTQRYLDARFSVSPVALAERVRTLLHHLLGSGRATHFVVAQMLGLQPRTMQRRLATEGKTFEDIKDGIRREQLVAMLGRGDGQPIANLAAALDYAEPSALTRSCRRWFGMSPSELKHSLALTQRQQSRRLFHGPVARYAGAAPPGFPEADAKWQASVASGFRAPRVSALPSDPR